MFEDSLVESCGQLVSGRRRWIAAASVGLQSLIALSLVAVPLLHPEALSFHTPAPAVAILPLRKPPVVVVQKQAASTADSNRFVPSVERLTTRAAVLPSLRPVDAPDPTFAGVGISPLGSMSVTGGGAGDLLGAAETGTGRRIVAAVVQPRPMPTVSSGVSAGMLVGEIRPIYPRIAVAAHVQGVVVVEATISRTGTIESARVVSGSAMLAGAALDAVRAARYHPYLLNGEATEVRTTVTVNFRLGEG